MILSASCHCLPIVRLREVEEGERKVEKTRVLLAGRWAAVGRPLFHGEKSGRQLTLGHFSVGGISESSLSTAGNTRPRFGWRARMNGGRRQRKYCGRQRDTIKIILRGRERSAFIHVDWIEIFNTTFKTKFIHVPPACSGR